MKRATLTRSAAIMLRETLLPESGVSREALARGVCAAACTLDQRRGDQTVSEPAWKLNVPGPLPRRMFVFALTVPAGISVDSVHVENKTIFSARES